MCDRRVRSRRAGSRLQQQDVLHASGLVGATSWTSSGWIHAHHSTFLLLQPGLCTPLAPSRPRFHSPERGRFRIEAGVFEAHGGSRGSGGESRERAALEIPFPRLPHAEPHRGPHQNAPLLFSSSSLLLSRSPTVCPSLRPCLVSPSFLDSLLKSLWATWRIVDVRHGSGLSPSSRGRRQRGAIPCLVTYQILQLAFKMWPSAEAVMGATCE